MIQKLSSRVIGILSPFDLDPDPTGPHTPYGLSLPRSPNHPDSHRSAKSVQGPLSPASPDPPVQPYLFIILAEQSNLAPLCSFATPPTYLSHALSLHLPHETSLLAAINRPTRSARTMTLSQSTSRKRPNPDAAVAMPLPKRTPPHVFDDPPSDTPPAETSTERDEQAPQLQPNEGEDQDDIPHVLNLAELQSEAEWFRPDAYGAIDEFIDEPCKGDPNYCPADDVVDPAFSDTDDPAVIATATEPVLNTDLVVDVDSPDAASPDPSVTLVPTEDSARAIRAQERRHRKPFYHPRLWLEGTSSHRLGPSFSTLDNGTLSSPHLAHASLDPTDAHETAELWPVLRGAVQDRLLFTSLQGLSFLTESRDFLRAANRLRHMVDPHHLSILLGPTFRTPQYCETVLAAFLALYNMYKVRRLCARPAPLDDNQDITVFEDGSFLSDSGSTDDDADDDAIAVGHAQNVAVDSKSHITIVTVSDSPHLDPVIDAAIVGDVETFLELNVDDENARAITEFATYAERMYMKMVTDVQYFKLSDLQQHYLRLGVTFEYEQAPWQTEPMAWSRPAAALAPALGDAQVLRTTTLPMWREAERAYSDRDLSRCALLRPEVVLRWLFDAKSRNADVKRSDDILPALSSVACITPSALLYLAEAAANFALQVVTVAMHHAEMFCDADEKAAECITISLDSIIEASETVFTKTHKRHVFLESHFGMLDGYKHKPLMFFPYTETECITLCDRKPVAKFNVPCDVIKERSEMVACFVGVPGKLFKYVNLPGNGDAKLPGEMDIDSGAGNTKSKAKVVGKPADHNAERFKQTALSKEIPSVFEWRQRYPELKAGLRSFEPIIVAVLPKDDSDLLEFEANPPEDGMTSSFSSVCAQRLAWLVLHAIGRGTEDANGDTSHMLGYGSTVNYTNFGHISPLKMALTMQTRAFVELCTVVDAFVKDEAAVLMECAVHDNDRPWIDGADVALVQAIRKDFVKD